MSRGACGLTDGPFCRARFGGEAGRAEESLLNFGQEVQVEWRIARLKTVGIGLVLALNIGVDPPDVFRCSPCAKLEAWIDPTLAPAAVSVENIAK